MEIRTNQKRPRKVRQHLTEPKHNDLCRRYVMSDRSVQQSCAASKSSFSVYLDSSDHPVDVLTSIRDRLLFLSIAVDDVREPAFLQPGVGYILAGLEKEINFAIALIENEQNENQGGVACPC